MRHSEFRMRNKEWNRAEETAARPLRQRDAKGRFVKGVSRNPGGRPQLPQEFRQYGAEAAVRLRAIADDPETPPKLKADIEKFFFEAVYGKAPGLAEKEDKGGGAVETVKFEGVLEEWSQ